MKTLFSALCLLTAFPALAAPFDMFRDCDDCPEMIELPLGEFMMGAPEDEPNRVYYFFEDGWRQDASLNPYFGYGEGPVHRVQIDIPFAMGCNEVTYDEWMACVNDGGCNGYIPDATIHWRTSDNPQIQNSQANGQYPAMRISYLDALSYVDWLNAQVGADVYRLPTEAEWEYAARAGTQTPFAQGEYVTRDQVNYALPPNHGTPPRANGIIGGIPVPVTTLKADNPWGLRHMSGNVNEVTMSCWHITHQNWSASSSYLLHASEASSCDRVLRGGAYATVKPHVRVAARSPTDAVTRLPMLGFRVLREIPMSNM
jgi:formylglycine-generating enzyme required for sulfatase activity